MIQDNNEENSSSSHFYISFGLIKFTAYSASNLLPIVEDGKLGYIDTSGNIVILPKFDSEFYYYTNEVESKSFEALAFPYYSYFSEGLATVRVGWKFLFITLGYSYGVIDTNGAYIINLQDDFISIFSEGLAVKNFPLRTFDFIYENKFGYIDKNNTQVIEPKFTYAGKFTEGLALTLMNNFFGYTDKLGYPVIANIFDDAFPFQTA